MSEAPLPREAMALDNGGEVDLSKIGTVHREDEVSFLGDEKAAFRDARDGSVIHLHVSDALAVNLKSEKTGKVLVIPFAHLVELAMYRGIEE